MIFVFFFFEFLFCISPAGVYCRIYSVESLRSEFTAGFIVWNLYALSLLPDSSGWFPLSCCPDPWSRLRSAPGLLGESWNLSFPLVFIASGWADSTREIMKSFVSPSTIQLVLLGISWILSFPLVLLASGSAYSTWEIMKSFVSTVLFNWFYLGYHVFFCFP